MKKDIENRKDLYFLVKNFYVKLMNDASMSHFFVDFTNPVFLEEHLQVLVDFWDNMLFYSGTYSKNAMKPHLDLQTQKPFQKKHFKQWLTHFNEAVDELYVGENAYIIKTRALSIATVMEIKIIELNKK